MAPAADTQQKEDRSRPAGEGRSGRRALPWVVIAFWIVVLAVTAPFAEKLSGAARDRPVDYLPASAESTRVEHLLQKLPGGNTSDALLVYHRDGGLRPADTKAAQEHLKKIAGRYEVRGGDKAPTVVSKDGATSMTALSVSGLEDTAAQGKAVDGIRDIVKEDKPEGLKAEVGGQVALMSDQNEVFQSIDGVLLLGTAGVVAVLLILIYRSPFLWLVPLGVVGVAASAAMAGVYGLIKAFDLTVTTMSTSVMTVLIFGAGTDYALLLVARYREELRHIERPYDAMRSAIRGCGAAVLASSGTVVAGLMCLMAADLNSSSGLGPVGAVGVFCALTAMMTLLPAVLVLLGRRVFWPIVPVYGTEAVQRRSLFAAMGNSAARRPALVLLCGVAALVALSVGAVKLPGALKQEDAFLNKPDSVTAMTTVGKAFPDASSLPITVVTRTPQAAEVEKAVKGTKGVATVQPGRSGEERTELQVFAVAKPESAGEKKTISALRGAVHDIKGAQAIVGGPTAQQMDLDTTNADDRRKVIPLVLVAVMVVLIALLRSLVAAAVLVLAVIASWGAAMGLSGLVFGPVLGYDGLDPSLPLLTFVFLIALGVDYGIFLMHRAREERLKGAGPEEAALTALRTTGGVITSAGVVLAATFAVLATLPLVALVEMGFIIAVGVLLDTFLVRTYLVTSASLLLKRWMWWPGKLSRGSMES
ncbi:MMPL family transporter [Streptomyces klenkii]|uniref:MMPL family transporter n=1 Tax=Streptomyces klenkii TaxID=1420899 RepID=A0A3B0AWY9_9ACTN|nr:MMPL family transporter [Streptomyces klenkii]RKN64386.1 MMPL family transporter [Streptomyces klenkii]